MQFAENYLKLSRKNRFYCTFKKVDAKFCHAQMARLKGITSIGKMRRFGYGFALIGKSIKVTDFNEIDVLYLVKNFYTRRDFGIKQNVSL